MPKMSAEHVFSFLRTKNGRPYFARVKVVSDQNLEGVQLSSMAGMHDKHMPVAWREAALSGAKQALSAHIQSGGIKIGVVVNDLWGTEVDSTPNTMEIAAFCATWQALGRSDADLVIEFSEKWQVRLLK